MAEPEPAVSDTATELIPAVETGDGIERTLELPSVPDEPLSPPQAPAAEAPAAEAPAAQELPTRIGEIRTGISREHVIRPDAVNPGPGLRSFAPAPETVTEPVPEPLPEPIPEPHIVPEPQPSPEPELPPEPGMPPPPPPDPGSPPPVPEPAPVPEPTLPPEPAPTPEPAPGPAPGPPAPIASTGSKLPTTMRGKELLLVLLSAVVVVLVVILLMNRGSDGGAAGGSGSSSTGQKAAATVKASITSYDPSGGSGFRKKGDTWTTQTYSSPVFGNLKPGVGLVLDLGAKHKISSVSFHAAGGPLRVELRAGDTSGGSQDYAKVAETSSASGATTLKGQDGGKHQYWMLWVTRLGSGNSAKISDVRVLGFA